MSNSFERLVSDKYRKIVGVFCRTCNTRMPKESFSEHRGSRPARCDDCIRKWEKREPRKSK